MKTDDSPWSSQESGGSQSLHRPSGEEHMQRIEKLAEKRVGEMLVDAGLIRKEDLEQALQIHAEGGEDTVKLLVSSGYISVDDLLSFLANLPGIYTVDLSQCEIDSDLIRRVPRELAETYKVFPVDREYNELVLAVARPLTNDELQLLERTIGMRLRPVLCRMKDVHAAIERYYSSAETLPPLHAHEWEALAAPLRLALVARLLREIDAFPALPETVTRVRRAMTDPKSSVRDVSDVITMDPPVAAKVLSVANSAAYGFPQQVSDITLAVTLLGLRETYSIVLSVAVLNILEKSKHMDYRRFWLESLCCAAATRYVMKAARIRHLAGAFVAGLLHDIGRVALAQAVPHLIQQIEKDRRTPTDTVLADEERLIGMTHAEAGYLLAVHWGFPEDIAAAIRFHHHPLLADDAKDLVAIVAVADALARTPGKTLEDSRDILDHFQPCLDILKIDREDGEAMIAEFLSRRDESLRDAML